MPCGFTPSRSILFSTFRRGRLHPVRLCAVRQMCLHFLRTICAKGAFIRTNVSSPSVDNSASAPLAFCSHFHCHVVSRPGRVYGLTQLPAQPRAQTNPIIMQASRAEIFERAPPTCKNWPKFCHIIVISRVSRARNGSQCCDHGRHRSGIPISWTSEQAIDREKSEVRFHHLKAFYQGHVRRLDLQGDARRRSRRNRARPELSCVRAARRVMEPIIGDFLSAT